MAKFSENVMADMCARARRDILGYARDNRLAFEPGIAKPGSDIDAIAHDLIELDQVLSRLSYAYRDLRKRDPEGMARAVKK